MAYHLFYAELTRGVLSYISYMGMCRPIGLGTVFGPFCSENGCTLCPFWSGIGYDYYYFIILKFFNNDNSIIFEHHRQFR